LGAPLVAEPAPRPAWRGVVLEPPRCLPEVHRYRQVVSDYRRRTTHFFLRARFRCSRPLKARKRLCQQPVNGPGFITRIALQGMTKLPMNGGHFSFSVHNAGAQRRVPKPFVNSLLAVFPGTTVTADYLEFVERLSKQLRQEHLRQPLVLLEILELRRVSRWVGDRTIRNLRRAPNRALRLSALPADRLEVDRSDFVLARPVVIPALHRVLPVIPDVGILPRRIGVEQVELRRAPLRTLTLLGCDGEREHASEARDEDFCQSICPSF